MTATDPSTSRYSYGRRLRPTLVDDELGDPVWEYLTPSQEKRFLFSFDSYFRLGWRTISIAGLPPTALQRFAHILFKPDSVAGRTIERGLEVLRRKGFRPVGATPVEVCGRAALELWRYQQNAATLDRIVATQLLMSLGPSLLVVLEDEHVAATCRPAAVRLATLKGRPPRGSATPPQDSLRCVMEALNPVMSAVHTPDDPADLIREIGLLGAVPEPPYPLDLFGSPPTGGETEVAAATAAVYGAVPARRLDPDASAHALQSALEEVSASHDRPSVAPHDVSHALEYLAGARRGECLRLCDFLDATRGLIPRRGNWDLAVVASHFISYDYSDEMLIPGASESAWTRAAHVV